MNPEQRKRLARLLATADEAYLVALANVGLVRRANKDLEAGGLTVEEVDECVIVKGSGWTVWMPVEGPLKARDDTKATGATRQILCAIIYLRDSWCPAQLAESVEAEPTSAAAATSEAAATSASAVTSEAAGASAAAKSPAATTSPKYPTVKTTSPLHVVRETGSASEGEALLEALSNVTLGELSKWAGKKSLAEGQLVLDRTENIEIESPLGLTVRFCQHDVEIRLLPTPDKGTRLLDQILSTAPKALHKRWVGAAVLAVRRKLGKSTKSASSETPDDTQSPRNRHQVLHDAAGLLEGILSAGVAHPSSRMIERLFTLSITAGAVHLPRLAHLLRSLAEEVSRLLTRHAAGSTQRLFSSMSWTYALISALQAAEPDLPTQLAGVARTQYDPAGDLPLLGVGCYPWQTDSGFEGLTVLFWDAQGQRFLSWSNSRQSASAGGFDVKQLYELEKTWSGAGSPKRVCRAAFVLGQARVNALGRLSSGQQSTVDSTAIASDPSTHLIYNPAETDFGERLFQDWSKLHAYSLSQYPLGLTLRNPQDRIVVLEPKAWGERVFDETQQVLRWRIYDHSSQSLYLSVPWHSVNENSIAFIESLKPEQDGVKRIVARVDSSSNSFKVEPLCFLGTGTGTGTGTSTGTATGSGAQSDSRVLNPAFDLDLIRYRQSDLLSRLRAKFGRDRIAATLTSEDDWEEGVDESAITGGDMPVGIRNILSDIEGMLLQLAESGTQCLSDKARERCQGLARTTTTCGLAGLAEALQRITSDEPLAPTVLWADYLCRLHRQAAAQLKLVS